MATSIISMKVFVAHSGQKRTTSKVVTMVALAVVLALLCCFATGTAASKPGGSVSLVEEKLSNIKKTGGPAGAKLDSRKDGNSKERPPRPPKVEQTSSVAVAESGTPGGRKLAAASGRELQALGDPCSVTIRNSCRSKKAFQVAFAYYSNEGASSGYASEGWWTVGFNKIFRFNGNQVLYVYTKTGLKPSSTTGSSASFCVASLPFTILDGDDGYFYVYDDDTGDYLTLDSCSAAGGYWQGGFWAPKYCGVQLTYINC